jgi:hypothetical protein
MTADRQQQLVLGGGEPDRLRLDLAPVEEPAQAVAEGQQPDEVVVGEPGAGSGTHVVAR